MSTSSLLSQASMIPGKEKLSNTHYSQTFFDQQLSSLDKQSRLRKLRVEHLFQNVSANRSIIGLGFWAPVTMVPFQGRPDPIAPVPITLDRSSGRQVFSESISAVLKANMISPLLATESWRGGGREGTPIITSLFVFYGRCS